MKSEMSNAGIPTTYAGTRFRSRLEAKWAAFFDMLGWKWEYEPFDCAGWIPDFLLVGKSATLVEVKPILRLEDLNGLERKYEVASETHEVLIVGAGLGLEGSDGGWMTLGWYLEFQESEPEPRWWCNASLMKLPASGVWDWCSELHSYHGRLTGWYDGYIPGRAHHDAAVALWREAGNLVQWKPRNTR